MDRDGEIRSSEAEANQDHSRLLLPAIHDLLAGDRPEAILVVIGPGAYAGIRVGIATAEGLALGLGIPVYGIGTLEAVALAAGFGTGTAIHPAGRGEFASQRWADGHPDTALAVAPRDSLTGMVAGEGAAALGGRGVTARERLEAALWARAAAIRAGTAEQGAEAFYLREPSITVSRRHPAAAN